MLETNQPQIERWAGMNASLAPTLQKEGEFFRAEGGVTVDYAFQRMFGKSTQAFYGSPIINLIQYSEFVVLQTNTRLVLISRSEFFIAPEDVVTVDEIPVTSDGFKVYA